MADIFKKWCVWGHPLHSHTHSYIHNGFYRAIRYMGYECDWLQNSPTVLEIAPNTVFITEGQVDTHIPLRPDCFYLLHNCNKEKYLAAGIPESNILRMLVLTERTSKEGQPVLGKTWNRYFGDEISPTIHDFETRSIFIRWATDLLPPEVDYMMQNLEAIARKKKTGLYFVGFYCGIQQEYGKFLEQYGIPYIPVGGFSDANVSIEENVSRIQSSLFAPAIVHDHQQATGYVACRIFKNISYGAFGVTNSQAVVDFFGEHADEYSLVFDLDLKKLTDKAFHRMMNRNFTSERKLMGFIRDEHTYVNRVQALIAGFLHHWQYLNVM